MSGITYLTKEALEQLKTEIQKLKTVDRPAASRAIAEARDKGDLRENAEYDAAKETQGLLEAKIQKLEGELANARVIDEGSIDTSKVSIMTKVTVTNLNSKQQVTYQLVSEKEADLKMGKISVTSPIARALIGKKRGAARLLAVTRSSKSRRAVKAPPRQADDRDAWLTVADHDQSVGRAMVAATR